jgi:hypothetical protein
MSYANHLCTCGGHKETDTMLCADCLDHLKDRPEMQTFKSDSSFASRRAAAIRLLSMARGRKQLRLQVAR